MVNVAVGFAVDRLPWPGGPAVDDVRRWAVPMAADGTRRFVANVECQVGAVAGESWALPITVPVPGDRVNAYVVSPFTHYVRYLEEELRLIQSAPTRAVAQVILAGLGGLMRAGEIDRVVTVNNWLLSTNLYPRLPPGALAAARDAVREAWPGHGVLFRSCNALTTPSVMAELRAAGLRSVVSRQVYIFDARKDALFRRKPYRRDWALIERHGYRVRPLTSVDPATAERAADLYRLLYLDKYSRHNPAFTPAFVRAAVDRRWLTVYGLERQGSLDGVVGFFERDGVMTTPLLGYDTGLPVERGLYRMLTALLSTLARERGAVLHRSSGAATFKRSRGAVPALEFSYVDVRHQPWRARAAWACLRAVTEGIGRPMLERYDR